MATKKEMYEEFRRNGVRVTEQLTANGTYAGQHLKWAEAWLARRRRQWGAYLISLTALLIALLSWLFPRS